MYKKIHELKQKLRDRFTRSKPCTKVIDFYQVFNNERKDIMNIELFYYQYCAFDLYITMFQQRNISTTQNKNSITIKFVQFTLLFSIKNC